MSIVSVYYSLNIFEEKVPSIILAKFSQSLINELLVLYSDIIHMPTER